MKATFFTGAMVSLVSPVMALNIIPYFEAGSLWAENTAEGEMRRQVAYDVFDRFKQALSDRYTGTITIGLTDDIPSSAGTLAGVSNFTNTPVDVAGGRYRVTRVWNKVVGGVDVTGAAPEAWVSDTNRYDGTIHWNYNYLRSQSSLFLETTMKHEMLHVFGMTTGLKEFSAAPTFENGAVNIKQGSLFGATLYDTMLRDQVGNRIFDVAPDGSHRVIAYQMSSNEADWQQANVMTAPNPGLYFYGKNADGTDLKMNMATTNFGNGTYAVEAEHVWRVSYRRDSSLGPNFQGNVNFEDQALLRALGYQIQGDAVPEPSALGFLALGSLVIWRRKR